MRVRIINLVKILMDRILQVADREATCNSLQRPGSPTSHASSLNYKGVRPLACNRTRGGIIDVGKFIGRMSGPASFLRKFQMVEGMRESSF